MRRLAGEPRPGNAPARTSIGACSASTSNGIPTPIIQTDPRNSGLEMSPWTYTMVIGAASRAENDTANVILRKGPSGTSASSATTVAAYQGQYVGEMSNVYSNHTMAAARRNPDLSVARRAYHVTQTSSASITTRHMTEGQSMVGARRRSTA